MIGPDGSYKLTTSIVTRITKPSVDHHHEEKYISEGVRTNNKLNSFQRSAVLSAKMNMIHSKISLFLKVYY